MLRVRREYQSWVAKESLEDYALRYAASSYRRWSPHVVAHTAIGGISFLALEAIGASITLSFGFANAMLAVAVVSALIFAVSLPIAYWCSAAHLDIDLLTRGAGFGYVGSTFTSLIYASFTFIFFAIETAIWAQALELALGLNIVAACLLCSLVIIPVVFFGVTAINRLQLWTQPLWIAMMVLPLAVILIEQPRLLAAWTTFEGSEPGRSWLLFGAAAGVLLSLVGQIGEQADYLRFLPERHAGNRRAWWAAMLAAGPGWIVIGALKICAGSLLAVLALHMGSTAAQATSPVHLYLHAYRQLVDEPALALALAAVFVTLSQVKINVTNAYSGSLAWSNCFVRLAHYHPGRVVWLVFNVVIALLLTLLGIFETLQAVLSVYSMVAAAWIGALVADLTVLKPAGISPPYIEFKRAHLYDFNPVGCGATLLASGVAVVAYAGAFGPAAQAFFGFIALALAFLAAIAIGFATRGRYYIARADAHFRHVSRDTLVECSICGGRYEAPDMAHCTFYDGAICSLCCGLELHCHDHCKRAGAAAGSRFEPHTLRRVGRFLGVFSVTAASLGVAFALTYRFMGLDAATGTDWIKVMLRLYVATLTLASLGIWWIVLSQESREQSERELLELMQHLERTRKDLVESEKLAALGGLVAGVAHEINTPVGVAVSTASWLSERTQAARSALGQGRFEAAAQQQYLSDAEESARLLLSNAQRVARLVTDFRQLAVERVGEARCRFDLRECIAHTLGDLGPRLDEAGVTLQLDVPAGIAMDSYPVALSQVLTNLVVNALQHAVAPGRAGSIEITARLDADDHVQLRCADDGRGIERTLQGRVFEPFFTTRRMLGGTGLGLYIVNQLVTRQLGGTIALDADRTRGTAFELRFPRVARQGSDVAGPFTRAPRARSDER